MVRIKLISSLKRFAGFDFKEISIDKPTPLRDLVNIDLTNEQIFVIINETKGGTMESIIENDDYVLLSPIFGGG